MGQSIPFQWNKMPGGRAVGTVEANQTSYVLLVLLTISDIQDIQAGIYKQLVYLSKSSNVILFLQNMV